MIVARGHVEDGADPDLPEVFRRPLPRRRASRRWSEHAMLAFGFSALGFVVSFGIAEAFDRSVVTTAAFGVSTILALVAVVLGIRSLPAPGAVGVLTGLFPVACGTVMTLLGALLTLLSTVRFERGRQLRRRGRAQLPPVVPDGGWAHLAMGVPESADRAALAAEWRANGRTEHASVAAFAQHTLELMSLGAPPRLIRAAQDDALDEIRHAELCFSLARALDGRHASPGPFPAALRMSASPRAPRPIALAKLACGSLVDGALHEGLSARVIARLARRVEVPAIRALLQELARDEGRHAAHGWDVVEWCLAEGGAPVAAALSGALRALPREVSSKRPAAAMDGTWEPFGIHGHALEVEQYGRTRADVLARGERLVAARTAA